MAEQTPVQVVKQQLEALDKRVGAIPQVQSLASQTNLPPIAIALGICAVVFAILVAVFGLDGVSLTVGFVYPFLATLAYFKSQNAEAETQLLSYWIIFGSVITFEAFFEAWIPAEALYHLLKTVFLVWAFLPPLNGATVIYNLFNTKVAPKLWPENKESSPLQFLQTYLDQLDAKLAQVAPLTQAATTLQIPRTYLAIFAGYVLVVLVVFGFYAATNVICFVYPLVVSVNALRNGKSEDKAFWLTYWVLFGFFGVLESLLYWDALKANEAAAEGGDDAAAADDDDDSEASGHPSPLLYLLIKLGLLLWCYLPLTNGAKIVKAVAFDPLASIVAGLLPGLLPAQGARPASAKKDGRPGSGKRPSSAKKDNAAAAPASAAAPAAPAAAAPASASPASAAAAAAAHPEAPPASAAPAAPPMSSKDAKPLSS